MFKAGKKIKPERKPLPEILAEMMAAFKKDKVLQKSFEALTFGKKGEYLDHILSAKTEETRVKRVEKASPNIKAGMGMNDKFK